MIKLTCIFIQFALVGVSLPLKVTVSSMIIAAAWIPTRLRTGAWMVFFSLMSLVRLMSDLQMYCSTRGARLAAFTLWEK